MKRLALLKHLREQGCVFIREGGSHSWWGNPQQNRRSSVPRHTEINATQKSTTILPARFARISGFQLENKRAELKRPFSFQESKATERSQIQVDGSAIQLELG